MGMPSAPALASGSLDLERLMGDLIPKLTPTKRRELRYLVSGLKTRKEIGGIPSVSAALVARAPALVGAHLWRACVEKQRREPCLLYTSPSPRDLSTSRMPSSA